MVRTLFTMVLMVVSVAVFAQKDGTLQIAFYNVENLFDTIDDPHKTDNEFLPDGKKQWTSERYYAKLDSLAKVINSMGEEKGPDVVGLCEVENLQVLEDLRHRKELKDEVYSIVHFESPDRRGIDVALLYRNKSLNVLHKEAITIRIDSLGGRFKTRDILYVKFKVGRKDTLHYFVNHWPSRMGGQEKSEFKRMHVAQVLRNAVDSILLVDANANVIIMGDMNDYPTDKSLKQTLGAVHKDSLLENSLCNLVYDYHLKGEGTYNYKKQWGVLDNVVVTPNMLSRNRVKVDGEAVIYKPEWILHTDKKGNQSPNRTYGGKNYYGGYSDHLPVYVWLKVR